jgi:hypothetical protein
LAGQQRPDIILVEPLGNNRFRVKAYQIVSGRQNGRTLEDELDDAWQTVDGTGPSLRLITARALSIGQRPS